MTYVLPVDEREAELSDVVRVQAHATGAPELWQCHVARACRLDWMHLLFENGEPSTTVRVAQIRIGPRVLWSEPMPVDLFSPAAFGMRFDATALDTHVEPGELVTVELAGNPRGLYEVRFFFKVPVELNAEGFPF